MSPYFEFKCDTALNKERYSNKFACWSNKRVHRELGFNNTSLVLQTVQCFQLPLVGQPTQATDPPQLQLSPAQQDLISTEIQTMIEKRTISLVQPDQRGFISQIFLVLKKDGGHRPVISLKALNKFIAEDHFKMEGFHMVKDLVKTGDWLAN